MNRGWIHIGVYTLLLALPAASQSIPDTVRPVVKKGRDTTYVRSYYNLLELGTQIGSQFNEYRTYYTDTFFLALRPNEVFTFSPVLDYRWLSLSYSFTPQILDFNNDDTLRGDTKFRRLSTSFRLGAISLSGSWSTTEGFYLNNMQTVFPQWKPGDRYLQFPDLKVRQIQLAALYRTNPNFSTGAVKGGFEEQLKSAWTWLPGININHFQFTSESADTLIGSTELTNNFDMNAVLAAAGTWVFARHAYVSAIAGPMVGLDYFNALAVDEEGKLIRSDAIRFSTGYYARLNLGYNRDRWYAGVGMFTNGYRHNNGSTERLAKIFSHYTIYAGLRMKAPKVLKKSMDWVETILPFLK